VVAQLEIRHGQLARPIGLSLAWPPRHDLHRTPVRRRLLCLDFLCRRWRV
jgi:hypothetical protein